ncbi:MAG: PEP-CTERM sorting domain-containing protein [Verrucomicrobiota bacterium]
MKITPKLYISALALLAAAAIPAHGQVFRIVTTDNAYLPFFETRDDSNPFIRGARFIYGEDASFGFGGADLDPPGTPRESIELVFTADLNVQTGERSNLVMSIMQDGDSLPLFQVSPNASTGETEVTFSSNTGGRVVDAFSFVTLGGVRVLGVDGGFSVFITATGYLGFEQPIDPVNGGRANLLPFDTSFNSDFATNPIANIMGTALLSSTETSSGFYINYTGRPASMSFTQGDLDRIAFGGFTTEDLGAQPVNFSNIDPGRVGNEAFVFAAVIDPGTLTADPDGVFDPGTSSASLFDEVIHVSDAPGAQTSIGASFSDQQSNFGTFIRNSIGDATSDASTTVQLNVADGGTVAADFVALSGSEVNITGGTVGNNFNAYAGTEINISGGTVGNDFDAFNGSLINISGGTVGDNFDAHPLSEVNISGGTVGSNLTVMAGSRVNISGGFVGAGLNALERSEVNISGGTVGSNFSALGGSVVNIFGGEIGDGFSALDDSQINLFGIVFLLDGVLLDTMVPNEAFTITDRDATLSGFLADGSEFSFDLNSDFIFGEDFFGPAATLTATLIPEPSIYAAILGCLGFGMALMRRRRRD